MGRLDSATGWRRRALRLVEQCMKLDAEHVLCKAMRRWPIAALLEATEGWTADMFAPVARDWRLRKVARLLEAKGRAFTMECCEEWEPEYLQMLLPALDLVTARHVLGQLYFESDDKHLSPWECRCILEEFHPRAQRKLLRKFKECDVTRVWGASESADGDGDSEEDEDEENSLAGFIVDGCTEGGDEEDESDDDEEVKEGCAVEDDDDDEVMVSKGCSVSDDDDDEDEEADEDDDDDGDVCE